MKAWSLRRKLQLFTAIVVALALALFGIGTAVNLYYEQIEALDDQLAREAKPLLIQLARVPDPAAWLDSKDGREILAILRHHSIAVEDRSGSMIYQTPDLRKNTLWGPDSARRFRTVHFGDSTFRLVVFEKEGIRIGLAVNLDEVDDVVDDLMLAYLFSLPLAVLAAAFGAWWITEKALAPVTAIAETADAITVKNLHMRLPEPQTRDEIARLTHILNRMLDRLERAFRSASRFSADASHELNTPLAIMRGRIEEALQSGKVGAESEPLLADLLEETARLSGIAKNLLLLARADAEQLDLEICEFNFTQLVEGALEDAEILAANKQITLHRKLRPDIFLRADSGRLRQVLLNLLENAVKYTQPGGCIDVELESSALGIVCTVISSGAAIPAEKAGQIFERFYRGDASRGGQRGHGLGLSICRELVRSHGGTIELEENRPGHVEFRIHLPISAGSS